MYPLGSFAGIKDYCRERDMFLWQYAEECEGPEIWDYLSEVWEVKKEAVYRGTSRSMVLGWGSSSVSMSKIISAGRGAKASATARIFTAYAGHRVPGVLPR